MDGVCIRILVCCLFWVTASARADVVNNEWYSPTRSQSMGNVGVASASDSVTAMFFNPAALARGKKTNFELLNPQFEMGTGVLALSGSKGYGKHASLEKVKPLLEQKPGKVSYLGFGMYPNIQAQNFNFGVLVAGHASSYQSGANVVYKSRYLAIPSIGISMGAFGGRLKLGVAARAIQITENDKSLPSTTTGLGYTQNASEGLGIGLDAGVLLSMPWASLPTLGITARNVGDTSFSGSAPYGIAKGTVERADKIKMTYDAGFAIFPKIGRRSTFTFAGDYRDVTGVYKVSTLRRVNVGMEFDLSNAFYFRLGVSRGYWTAGFGVASKRGTLDIGSYGEELDATGFRVKEDRRMSLRFGSRF